MKELNSIINSFLNDKRVEGYDKDLKVFKEFLEYKGVNRATWKEFLQGVRTKKIIESLDYYIKNNKLTSINTALRYISCIKEFFLYVISNDIIENRELAAEFAYPVYNEKSFRAKVNKFIAEDKRLIESEGFIAIDFKTVEDLIEACDSTLSSEELFRKAFTSKIYYNKFRSSLILKLILLTGIKYDILHTLEKDILNLKYNTIEISGFEIHLPNNLRDNFEKYEKLLEKIDIKNQKRKYLFVEYNGNKISNKTYITSYFLKIAIGRSDLNGIIKYTVIEMIKKGINESIIKNFTGIGEDMYNECQKFVNEQYKIKQNRYLDSKIRSLEIYDLL